MNTCSYFIRLINEPCQYIPEDTPMFVELCYYPGRSNSRVQMCECRKYSFKYKAFFYHKRDWFRTISKPGDFFSVIASIFEVLYDGNLAHYFKATISKLRPSLSLSKISNLFPLLSFWLSNLSSKVLQRLSASASFEFMSDLNQNNRRMMQKVPKGCITFGLPTRSLFLQLLHWPWRFCVGIPYPSRLMLLSSDQALSAGYHAPRHILKIIIKLLRFTIKNSNLSDGILIQFFPFPMQIFH